jgi:hypothetical protein
MRSQPFAILAIALTLMVVAGSAGATPTTAAIHLRPHRGPPGTHVRVKGDGFVPKTRCGFVTIWFIDANGVSFGIGTEDVRDDGTFQHGSLIPADAAVGLGAITAQEWAWVREKCRPGGRSASHGFTVTSSPRSGANGWHRRSAIALTAQSNG